MSIEGSPSPSVGAGASQTATGSPTATAPTSSNPVETGTPATTPTLTAPPTASPTGEPTSPPTDTPAPTKTPKPTAAAAPNLVVTKFSVDADPLLVETPFDATFTIRNAGDADAGPFTAAIQETNADDGVKGPFDPSDVGGGLAAGDSVKVTISVFLSKAGNWTLTAIADLKEKVDESNENDNSRDLDVKVLAGLPDLAWFKDGFSVFDQAEATAEGNKIELQAKFQNVGTAPYASSPFIIGVTWYRDEDSASGDLNPFAFGDDMEPGATSELSKIDFLPGPGTYTLYAYLDDGRVVDELSEDNNEAQARITIN